MRLPARLAALLNRPRGGAVNPRPDDGTMVTLSPGRLITDPDEADALGLTADARRMRRDTAAPDEPTA